MDFESSMQNIGWIRDRYLEGTLTIKPPYQRKPVWAIRQKCLLIESILMGLPVPEVYIQQLISGDDKTSYAIVDGQQRIRTVLQFIGSETEPKEQEYNKFALDKLPPDSVWAGKTFGDIPDQDRKKFFGYKFVVRYLNTGNDQEVRDMFRRLNANLTPLKPQELRNATYTGPFMRLALKLADNEYWAENRIVTPAAIRRMGDVEFVSELLIGVLHGPQGGGASIIDSYYQQYEDYEDEFPDEPRARKLFDDALLLMVVVLPDVKDTRWSNKTDFYTLFVTVASLLASHELPRNSFQKIRAALDAFADEVATYLSDETVKVSEEAISYARAHEKGANDKKRRADRHASLLSIIGTHFVPKKPPA